MKSRKKGWIAAGLLAAFVLWTAAVCLVDVQQIGPEASAVGLATMNRAFHRLTGVHWTLYDGTDWLSLIPMGWVLGFAALGLIQWIKRKSIRKVDGSILILGGFYAVVMMVYLLFERFVVNYRPVLIAGVLEASYPSSTTMLTLCVMLTAMMQMNSRMKPGVLRRTIVYSMAMFTAFMVVGRLVSGVHWLSDIIGGLLISAGLIDLYVTVCDWKSK